ncbi:fumarylacetoacetate hydrolase family protein [Streptomyces sp. NBC_01320]|uniref:fumarylacetoacetate hydrolase family protein n=1 Tax=Streptomyces sp. NBC_01320 TaxID=2903824 RepID=UPI002E124C83|nr:fumarylacetoacetate hydrolase family protein [Streptomyces sp. NBC_01320]
MASHAYRLCTYRYGGFESVGLGLGESPTTIVDVERCFTHLHREQRQGQFVEWPTRLDMLAVLTNWDYFTERLEEVARRAAGGELPAPGECGFVHRVQDVRFAAPLANPGKILNAGANYYDHIKEMGTVEISPETDVPYIFPKTPNNCIIGDGEAIRLPKKRNWDVAQYVDWEAELAVVIGRTAEDVSPQEANDYIAGYTIYQDISGRDNMIRETGPFPWDWYANKCNDTFAPMGPWIVPQEFLPDVSDLRIRSVVNGEVQQDSSTKHMIWTVQQLVSYASEVTRLEPGDVIATGTPAGVGMAQGLDLKPGELPNLFPHMYAGGGRFLKAGDTLVTDIEGLGTLTNPVR